MSDAAELHDAVTWDEAAARLSEMAEARALGLTGQDDARAIRVVLDALAERAKDGEIAEAVRFAEAAALTLHCNYLSGPECFTATWCDVVNGGPDVFCHGATWLEAITALRARLA